MLPRAVVKVRQILDYEHGAQLQPCHDPSILCVQVTVAGEEQSLPPQPPALNLRLQRERLRFENVPLGSTIKLQVRWGASIVREAYIPL